MAAVAAAAGPVGHADPGSGASPPRTRAAGRPVAVGAADDVGVPWLQQERRSAVIYKLTNIHQNVLTALGIKVGSLSQLTELS